MLDFSDFALDNDFKVEFNESKFVDIVALFCKVEP